MASLADFRIEKLKAQRNRIRAQLKEGVGAELEMPNHEVIFPENVEWLKSYGIKVVNARDRDGRPINFVDISEMGSKDIKITKGIFEEETER